MVSILDSELSKWSNVLVHEVDFPFFFYCLTNFSSKSMIVFKLWRDIWFSCMDLTNLIDEIDTFVSIYLGVMVKVVILEKKIYGLIFI